MSVCKSLYIKHLSDAFPVHSSNALSSVLFSFSRLCHQEDSKGSKRAGTEWAKPENAEKVKLNMGTVTGSCEVITIAICRNCIFYYTEIWHKYLVLCTYEDQTVTFYHILPHKYTEFTTGHYNFICMFINLWKHFLSRHSKTWL